MSAGQLIVELIVVLIFTVCVLHKYANWRRIHLIVFISTLIAWYFSFVIIFVLPLDVSLTFYNRCLMQSNATTAVSLTNESRIICEQPGGYVADGVLLSLWRVVYWSAQLLTWIILPLMQTYSQAGDFSAWGKLRTAVRNNVIYYGSYLLIFGVLLIYAAMQGISLNGEHLKVLLVSASNTWGLFLLVLLLGYGLVEVPRQIWLMGSKGYRLNKTYFDVEKLSADKNDADDAIRETYRDAREALNSLRNGHPFKIYAQTIVDKFPVDIADQLDHGLSTRTYSQNSTDSVNLTISSEKYLIRLHQRVIEALQNHQRTHAQWRALIQLALHLEEVAKNENSPQPTFMRTYRVETSIIHDILCTPKIEYYWECVLKRPLLKSVGVILFIMTAIIAWSECTFFIVHPRLSIAAIVLHAAANGYHYKYIELCAVITIAYLCVCAYYTVFKLRLYRYYNLDPHQQTNENSLLFSAILLCRLTPPLCLNFLGMIQLDSKIASNTINLGVETQFTKLMGHLTVIPLVANGINIYLPILIMLLCLGTWFRIGTRILHSLGIDQFVGDDDMTIEMIQGGKSLVTLERNHLGRDTNRQQRDQYWSGKLHNVSSSSKRGVSGRNSSDNIDYTDRDPIITASSSSATKSHNREEDIQDLFRASSNRNYGSSPPTNLFDDL